MRWTGVRREKRKGIEMKELFGLALFCQKRCSARSGCAPVSLPIGAMLVLGLFGQNSYVPRSTMGQPDMTAAKRMGHVGPT
jgi:hypothetical protein